MTFETVVGIQPGFGFETKGDPVELVSRAWKELCEKEFKLSGINISAIILPCRAVYIGPCEEGGERCAYMFGVYEVPGHSAYTVEAWRMAVSKNCEELRKIFEQEFLMVTFSGIERTHTYEK